MNIGPRYGSLAELIATELYIYDIRGGFSFRDTAVNPLLTKIKSL